MQLRAHAIGAAAASATTPRRWQDYIYRLIACEISTLSRYYDSLVQLSPLPNDPGMLIEAIDGKDKYVVHDTASLPDFEQESGRAVVLLNGNFNYETDIQGFLSLLRLKLGRTSRVVVVAYNSYFAWLFRLASFLGLRKGEVPCTFLTEADVINLARLSGYEVTSLRWVGYFPFRLMGLGTLINRVMPAVPIVRRLALTELITMRPRIPETRKPSLSIIIPARNERGNIESSLARLPRFEGADIEVIFVEGHSTDGTWEEIQRVLPLYSDRYKLSAYKQAGKGKANAVRLGFTKATKELLVILDADLSVPPELLTRFYDAYRVGLGDFVNGSRLLYPIEGKAMKFLNKLGNVFFAKVLSRVLGTPLTDSLCGTKLFSRDSYERFCAWRRDFGDFDPFGDFELLFPAAILNLGIIDVPIRYRDRLYGQTNIRRFYHGLMLLRMTLIGFFKIALGRAPRAKATRTPVGSFLP